MILSNKMRYLYSKPGLYSRGCTEDALISKAILEEYYRLDGAKILPPYIAGGRFKLHDGILEVIGANFSFISTNKSSSQVRSLPGLCEEVRIAKFIGKQPESY